MNDSARMLVFRLGAERFALPLADVDEVVEMPAIQPLPASVSASSANSGTTSASSEYTSR